MYTVPEVRVEFQAWGSDEWVLVGTYTTMQGKADLYDKVDDKKGHVRSIQVCDNALVFYRPTAVTPRPASDDCHTYS